jgi:phage virion morphogenesis protein
MRDIARELRRSQQARIAVQRNPDGTAYEPRKVRTVAKKLRDKRGRLKRTAMFTKLRTARWMTIEASDTQLATGFSGRIARIARVHQFGESTSVVANAPKCRYPMRELLGLTHADREAVREQLLKHIAQ